MTTEATCFTCAAPTRLNSRHCSKCGQKLLYGERYRVLSMLGGGGFGVVYKALDMRLDRVYAMKEIRHGSPYLHEQILIEVNILKENARQLGFIPEVYDFLLEEGCSYLVMEYVEGTTLERARPMPWPAAEVEHFLRELLTNLTELHRRNIIHRDLKPQNIMRRPDGRYMLIDFGIAKEGEVTRRAAKAASNHFAPPEQFKGTTDARSDLYSLGATAYVLLTNSLVPETGARRQGVPIVWPHELGIALRPELDRLLRSLLAMDHTQRPLDAQAALAMLSAPKRMPPPLYVPPPPPPPWLSLASYRLPAAIGGLVLAGGLALTLAFGARGEQGPGGGTTLASAQAMTAAALASATTAPSTEPTDEPQITRTAAPTRTALPTRTPVPTQAPAPTSTVVARPPDEGDRAPDFALTAAGGDEVSLESELRDHRSVVVVFYYGYNCEPCITQLAELAREYERYTRQDAQVIALASQDEAAAQRTLANVRAELQRQGVAGEVPFPILADPDGAVARAYGVADFDSSGRSRPAVFIVGDGGTVVWKVLSEDTADRPGAFEILRAVP